MLININYFGLELPTSKDPILKSNNSIQNPKIIDMLIDSLTSADSVFQDDDIWYMLVECIDEIIKNKNMVNNVVGETFKKVYYFYFRINQKFNGDKEKQALIKNSLNYLIKNSFCELNLFINYSLPEDVDSEQNRNNNSDRIETNKNDKMLLKIYEKLGTAEYIENSIIDKFNPLDLFVCRTLKSMVDTICYRAAKGELVKNITSLVPKKEQDFFKPIFRSLKSPEIYNEYNI